MNLAEARAIVSKLYPFQGQVMKPYRAPVENFIIVPAGQQEFDEIDVELHARVALAQLVERTSLDLPHAFTGCRPLPRARCELGP